MSCLICFEGIDGSGKTTQIELLRKLLESNKKTVLTRSYPMYDSFFGMEIGKLLSAENCEKMASNIEPMSMALWYAADRWLDYQKHILSFDRYDYILLNRYTLSNIVYQSIRSSDCNYTQEWINTLEHTVFGLPKPDIYLIFDINIASARTNISKKGKRDYIDEMADVYESDHDLQLRARDMYLELANKLHNTKIINCFKDGNILNVDTIFNDVVTTLSQEGIM